MNYFKLRSVQSTAAVGIAGLWLSMSGCAQPAANAYPSSPPPTPQPAMAAPTATNGMNATGAAVPIKVPADAKELSSGDYPPPGFTTPMQTGLIMVVDLDGDPTTAVATTTVTALNEGKTMSITDVPNMTISMNKLHKYRIVFVPAKP